MAVASFVRKPDGRTVQMSTSGAWEHTDRWLLTYDSKEPDPLAFRGDPGVFALGDEHPENSDLLLKRVANGRSVNKSFTAWEFDLVWSTISLEPDKHDPQRYDNPLVATKSWGHQQVQEVVEKAYVSDDGGSTFSSEMVPVGSTEGDLFVNPALMTTRYLSVCNYSRNQLTVSATVLKLPGWVNSDSFTLDGLSVTAGQALCLSAAVSSVKRDILFEFRNVDFQIIIREEGWDDELLNRGVYIKNQAGNRQRAPLKNTDFDENDQRQWVFANEPVPLNADGQNEDYFAYYNPGDPFVPHYRIFRYRGRTSFNSLGFT